MSRDKAEQAAASWSEQFGQPSMPVEFPLVAICLTSGASPQEGPTISLYQCPVCRALVVKDDAQPHADWHSAEYSRNFHGF